MTEPLNEPSPSRCVGLLRRRLVWMPTRRGWLVLGCFLLIFGSALLIGVHPFLALNNGWPGGALVVEGWTTDTTIEAAVKEFRGGQYQKLYVTGGPLEFGAPLSEYRSYAERGAAVATKLGLVTNDQVQAVPAPLVKQDRTYASAVSLDRWFRDKGSYPANLHLISEGPHARRSRLLFQKAFHDKVPVSVTAVPPRNYEPSRWWRTSSGVRVVLSESIGYAYVRLFFSP